MIGRRLLDVAAILKASRAVASKHFALQEHRFDTYNKTSSLAKAFKSQSDRVTLTLRAAVALNQRFKDPVTPDLSSVQKAHDQGRKNLIPKEESVGNSEIRTEKDDIELEQGFEGIQEKSVTQAVSNSDQEGEGLEAVVGLPKESITEAVYKDVKHSQKQAQRTQELPPVPVQEPRADPQLISLGDTQARRSALDGEPKSQNYEDVEPLKDVYSEIFHSPRVAKLLSRNRSLDGHGQGAKANGIKQTPVTPYKSSVADDRNSKLDTRTGASDTMIKPSKEQSTRPLASQSGLEADIHDLATDVLEENQHTPEKLEACFQRCSLDLHHWSADRVRIGY